MHILYKVCKDVEGLLQFYVGLKFLFDELEILQISDCVHFDLSRRTTLAVA